MINTGYHNFTTIKCVVGCMLKNNYLIVILKLEDDIMKKVELHLHLDGSIRVKTASELAGISYECAKSKMVVDNYQGDLNEYLTKFDFPVSLMQTKENLIRISKELAEDLVKDEVIYAEIRFALEQHVNLGLTYDEIIESVLTGLGKVKGVKTNLILCMMRNHSEEINKKVIDTAKKYLQNGVCSVDLAGAEALFPTKSFKGLFMYAKEKGVPFTIHAGEADGPESIKAALCLGTKRLGHGVRIIEDDYLLAYAKDNNIILEVCPTSNLQTGIFKSIKEHSVRKLYDTGVKVTVNTDNRTVSNTNLNKEYMLLKDELGFSDNELKQMNKWAIEAAFLSKGEKDELLKKIEINC